MVSRFSARTRARRRKRRRKAKHAPPNSGWTLRQLGALAQIAPRTISDYVRRGLLTAPEFRGAATRYQREHLLRLMAVKFTKAQGVHSLKAVKARLESMGHAELEAWLTTRELSAAVVSALNLQTRAGAVASAPSTESANGVAQPEAWQRMTLVPGLELSFRKGSGALTQDLANALYKHFESIMRHGLNSAAASARVGDNPDVANASASAENPQ